MHEHGWPSITTAFGIAVATSAPSAMSLIGLLIAFGGLCCSVSKEIYRWRHGPDAKAGKVGD